MSRPNPNRTALILSIGALALIAGAALALRAAASAVPAPFRPVRDAGPANMTDPPRTWDPVDDQSDASFPASDPPGGY
jgi:hypothetical protein